jgi:hypothetical protein
MLGFGEGIVGALPYRPLVPCVPCQAARRAAPAPGTSRAAAARRAAEAARCAAPQEWFGGVSLLGFLRDVGKHARVGTMLSRDSVRSRMEADNEGMSFTECAPGPAWPWAAGMRVKSLLS